jgi:hypothetical protein
MYETFTKPDIDIFQNINKSLITDDKIQLYQNTDYAIIDIRYDNKLICNIDKENKLKIQDDKFIIYTPQYYIDMMRLINGNLIIIIITDSKEIIIKYILRTYYNKNNFIFIDTNYINSFYLYYNAKHIIMSNNTFSMAGSYFNMSNVNNINNNKLNNNKNIYYLFYRDKNSKYSLPEEKAISDKWNIESYKKYILNYNILMITDICKFITDVKRNKNKQKLINIKFKYNLANTYILPFYYKNQTQINYNSFLYKIKMIIKNKSLIKNPYSFNKFNEELYFEKILNDNNIKSSIFITKNIWSSYFKRIFDYSDLKIYTLYINEHDNNNYDLHKPLSYYITKEIQKYESLILFFIKNDYGVEFDFIYDYYMFKINEYLNTVKTMKLLIISYSPNLILPFTLNTLINICNHSESYKIITINNNVYIIFNNIKNYNIDIQHLKSNFINMYNNILYMNNEDILEDIAHSQNQINNNSIGNTHYYKFNNYTKNSEKYNKLEHNNNYEYKINIINYPFKVNNENFITDLLINIYEYYDNISYILDLFTIKNIENKTLFENYYYKIYNRWSKLIYGRPIEKKSIKLSIKTKKTLKSIKKSINIIKLTKNN